MSFNQTYSDPCLHASFDSEGVVFLVAIYMYVDDIVLGGWTEAEMNAVRLNWAEILRWKIFDPFIISIPAVNLLAAFSQLGSTISDWKVKLLGMN